MPLKFTCDYVTLKKRDHDPVEKVTGPVREFPPTQEVRLLLSIKVSNLSIGFLVQVNIEWNEHDDTKAQEPSNQNNELNEKWSSLFVSVSSEQIYAQDKNYSALNGWYESILRYVE